MLPNVSIYAGFYHTIYNNKYGDPVFDLLYSTYPSEDNIAHASCVRGLFEFFTSCLLSPPHHFEKKNGGAFKTILLFVLFMAEQDLPWREKCPTHAKRHFCRHGGSMSQMG